MSERRSIAFLAGTSDKSIPFDDLLGLLRRLGFDERVRGAHHIFSRDGILEILNLQPRGRQAKAYQVRQVRGVILAYGLAEELRRPGACDDDTGTQPME